MASSRGRRLLALVVGAALCGGLLPAYPHGDEPGKEAPRPRPVNLRVLSPDIAPASLGRLMKQYEADLGVTCSYCHVENRDSGKVDYVSDENPAKQTARLMISMLEDINSRHLAQLGGDRRYAVPVTCGSCHQGRSNPPVFEPRHRQAPET